ncbi:MAG: U32 family peptidase [Thermodesulfobacteriota bacterium]|nr:U32 family peptidase [Thermodesulfobacteriota bacterium]
MQAVNTSPLPEILAPAGDRSAFLAAVSAGADAVYAGLKAFSARSEAKNFSISELAGLTELARKKGTQVFIAMNSLVKPLELPAAGRLVHRLTRDVRPAALIVQDLSMINLARQAGFRGEIHVSTLAGVTNACALKDIQKHLKADRVVLPRELSIDEIQEFASACPPGLSLEVFVHGALCFNISGRCYWSSYLGGKSGLRGRCVQPCRRVYAHKGQEAKFFSCRDLSLDVLAKTLLSIPQIRTWKIEGRKKGAHYVYYTVSAYKLLRDEPTNPKAKKTALELLERALGRPGTHYTFLPQKPYCPTDPGQRTASGLLVSKTGKAEQGFFIRPRLALIANDLLRVGEEGESWHQIVKIKRAVPKGGRLDVRAGRGKNPRPGTPVLLIDRREPELARSLKSLEKELQKIPAIQTRPSRFVPALPKVKQARREKPQVLSVHRALPTGKFQGVPGVWLSPKTASAPSKSLAGRIWWWLPPVIWPNQEKIWARMIQKLLRAGAKHFVLNALGQACLFGSRAKNTRFFAGPFCNTANVLSLQTLKDMGFGGAFLSPELNKEDLLALPRESPLPLGAVTFGRWPLGVSRIEPLSVKPEQPLTSPKGELCWVRRHGQNTWIYPGWGVDLRYKEPLLAKAGYTVFAHLFEKLPKAVPRANRPGAFNWDLRLL